MSHVGSRNSPAWDQILKSGPDLLRGERAPAPNVPQPAALA